KFNLTMIGNGAEGTTLYGVHKPAKVFIESGKEKAKELCKKIATQIKEWAKKQRELTTKEISEKIISLLNKKDKKVAYMYKSFKDIS
ncbi:TPA: hypothetical protein EYQ19_01780, partial [Candidatus Pacearchaeota archaeon]|nr:hypothetical protein [Candidatus Pacearchaeota archaeon]